MEIHIAQCHLRGGQRGEDKGQKEEVRGVCVRVCESRGTGRYIGERVRRREWGH